LLDVLGKSLQVLAVDDKHRLYDLRAVDEGVLQRRDPFPDGDIQAL
jgi:hypothetical protein